MRSGGYNTKAKSLMLEFIESNGERAFTAEDISSYLYKAGSGVSITTVYRFLERLLDEGKLIKASSEGGKRGEYLVKEDGDACMTHLHLQCKNCGKIVHLDCEEGEEFIKHLGEEHGFSIECGSSVLYGICDECRGKGK